MKEPHSPRFDRNSPLSSRLRLLEIIRLDLPDGELAAVAGVQTFGDYLKYHPHVHILAATGLIDAERRFHEMPVEGVEALKELLRHRFLAVRRGEKLISEKKLRQLLG